MEAADVRPPLFTNRQLVGLTIPIVIDALLAIVAGMVDSAMVSSAGEAAVSAVSLVDSLNLLFIAVFSAIAVGGSVVTAQYMGSRNYERASVSANQLLYASVTIAGVFMLILMLFREPVLRLVYGKIEADVFANASTYFFFTLLGYPFFAAGASSAAVLRSMGKNRQAVTITIVYNILNVIGNATLIYGFHLGVAGAAISTTFSRMVYAIVGLYLAHNKALPAHFFQLLKFRLDFDVMRRVLRIGLTQGLENGLFQVGKLLIASLVSSFGTVAIAANSVSFTLNNIGWTIIGSFSTVALTVVGQCIGAGQPQQARDNTKKLIRVATVLTAVLFTTVFLTRHHLVRLFDFGPEALEAAAHYTGISAIMSICSLYAFSFVPIAAFRAAGDIKYAVTLSVSSMFALRVALCYILNAIFPSLGLLCVYIGMFADWSFRSACNISRLHNGRWLHKKVI